MSGHSVAGTHDEVEHFDLSTAAVLLFSFSSGATDAFVFLTFGGVFTANMTGNLVLMGMFTRPLESIGLAATAVVAFAVAAFLGFRLTRGQDTTELEDATGHRRVPALLWISVFFQVCVVLLWVVVDVTRVLGQFGVFVLIGVSASVHALQTAGAKRVPAAIGTTTTYMTGTMVTLLENLAKGRRAGRKAQLGSIVCLVVGAVAGAAMVANAPLFTPVVPLVASAAAVMCIWIASVKSR